MCFTLFSFSISLHAQIVDFLDTDSLRISERWELEPVFQKGTFRLVPYRPFYVTAARWSDNPNKQPLSENPDYSAPVEIPYNAWEAKFQISFKTKIWQGVFGKYGDIWVGYTQIAHWQIYNTTLSRPFRELNYEPELILTLPTKISFGQTKLRMLSAAFVHQSNGRALPLSRSWNRIIFQALLQLENWQFNLRPWIRIPDENDENPEITNYIGRAAIEVIYGFRNQVLYAIITHPFNRIDRGSLQLNYVFPMKGRLRLQLQAFTGYGETLVDYNHSQTTLGLGISFLE